MLNGIFIFFVASSVLAAAFGQKMPALSSAALAAAKSAADLAFSLVGQMALWLGFMAILREAGLMRALARGIAPIMRRLCPDVPADHPALGSMMLNISANVLGLGNAATPFGLRAMTELDTLNPRPGVATNAMSLFLAINTAGVATLPLSVIAIRATLGARAPAAIVVPTLLATLCSSSTAVLVAKLTERWPIFAPERTGVPERLRPASPHAITGLAEAEAILEAGRRVPAWRWAAIALFAGALGIAFFWDARALTEGGALAILRDALSAWLLPSLMAAIVLIGFARGVRVYETFVQGAKEGFQIAITIIPYLVAILVAVGMYRASGLLDRSTAFLAPLTDRLGIPPETLPMALIRPLSGNGAIGVMTDILKTHGPDSFPGFVASVMNGSTETTFYVLAVYMGSINIRAARHTLLPCLAADLVGMLAAVYWSRLFYA